MSPGPMWPSHEPIQKCKQCNCDTQVHGCGQTCVKQKRSEIHFHIFIASFLVGIFCRCTLTSRHENEEELDRLRKQAEEGGPEEKIIVAHILEFGTGAAGNSETSLNHKEEALMWYKRAAQEGNARATWSFAVLQRALAKMDEEKLVIELLRKRVEEGDEACAGELGVR